MITLRLTRDEITPDLRRLLRQAAPGGPLANVLGRAAANELKKHFRARNSQGNKLGGKRTHFWSRVAQSVQSPRQTGRQIIVPVSHPAIAQKVFGGTITARKRKNLAIPIDPRGHGKSPRVFPALQFAMTKAGVKLLGLRENGAFKAIYVLKPSVTQDKDPQALPPPRTISAALTRAAEIHLRPR